MCTNMDDESVEHVMMRCQAYRSEREQPFEVMRADREWIRRVNEHLLIMIFIALIQLALSVWNVVKLIFLFPLQWLRACVSMKSACTS